MPRYSQHLDRHSEQGQDKNEIRQRIEDDQIRRAKLGDQQARQGRSDHTTDGITQRLQRVGSIELLLLDDGGDQGWSAGERDHHQESMDGSAQLNMPEFKPVDEVEDWEEGKGHSTNQVVDEHDPRRRESIQ